MAKPNGAWYKLDNAGVLYSAVQKEKYSANYRFSAVMEETVDPQALQRAVDRVMPRFPGFGVRIRKGLFWYYCEPNEAPGPFVKEDISSPCPPVRFNQDNGWLVRFFYYEKRISIEVFHAISDGAGALTFFRTLLAEYLRQRGIEVPCSYEAGVFDPDEEPRPEELEDAYARYAGKKKKRPWRLPRAYQNVGTPEPFYTFHVTMGFVSIAALKQKAKSYGASITEYLAAVLMKVILEKQEKERPLRPRPVALAVAINLRGGFPSGTLRNFITTIRPEIDPSYGEYTFEEIVAYVRNYMKLHVNRQELRAAFSANVSVEQHRLLRMVPIMLKNPVMAFNYVRLGTRPYSATFTNPGAFPVPEEMRPHIHHMEAILGQAVVARPHCACMSYGDIMTIAFAGTQKETDTEREFFRFLVKEGLHVKVESDRV